MIGVAMFVRLNWVYKSILTLLAATIYLVVILVVRPCLFDNYDKTIYGICWQCSWLLNLRYFAIVNIITLLLAILLLGRHV